MWQDKSTSILRYLVNDDARTSYTDAELQRSFLISAEFIQADVDFNSVYAVDIVGSSITPDPIDDDDFINLACLKSTCSIFSQISQVNAQSISSIKDGPSTIMLNNASLEYRNLAKAACDAYQHAILQYQLGNSIGANAVVGPVTNESANVDWGNLR